MATEIEIKLAVASHDAVRATLQHLGATPLGLTHEINTFLDTPDAALRSADKGLRIRRNTRSSGETLVVTFKGPRQSEALKTREEIELQVSDHDSAVELFARLGYAVTLSFEKQRESWSLGNCSVELDTLPHKIAGGTFLEIEGPTASAVRHALAQMGLSDHPEVKESYIQLVAKWAESHPSMSKTVRFEA